MAAVSPFSAQSLLLYFKYQYLLATQSSVSSTHQSGHITHDDNLHVARAEKKHTTDLDQRLERSVALASASTCTSPNSAPTKRPQMRPIDATLRGLGYITFSGPVKQTSHVTLQQGVIEWHLRRHICCGQIGESKTQTLVPCFKGFSSRKSEVFSCLRVRMPLMSSTLLRSFAITFQYPDMWFCVPHLIHHKKRESSVLVYTNV
ncbi:hypothetical protein CC86DRAFT_203279 [Ophiobolus disseminans]|uniref:Uncharacterized protein n=1 Tax=Ophiobolus disseminans TaxID=1469910 RepID=A0A6A7A4F6_9PLEO|nr:hypothetical protein CC86DRAFT_203279 [Ophiobolus disseminans]